MVLFASPLAELDLVIRDDWGAGFVADLSLTPSQGLNGWTVSFDFAGEIANIWNARVVSRVGDRYVVERMRNGGFNLGGEQSGHIVMTDYATTGDGLLASLQFLAELVRTGRRASEVLHVFDPVPQLLKNVRFSAGQAPLDMASVKSAIAEAEGELNGNGRLLIRKSGTEPLIRVMAESEDAAVLEASVAHVVQAVQDAVTP